VTPVKEAPMEAVLFLDSKEETRPVDRRVSFEAIS